MIFIITFSFILGISISLFVLSPLFNSHKKEILLSSPMAGEFELTSPEEKEEQLLLGMKDIRDPIKLQKISKLIFKKMIYGSCENEKINQMDEAESLEILYVICEKLNSAGLSWKDNIHERINLESGKFSLNFIIILLMSLCVIFFSFYFFKTAKAQESTDLKIPPPIIFSNKDYWVPSVNQYILTPLQGSLHVYYVGMFSNQSQKQIAKILLPFPKNIMNLQIHSKENASLDQINMQKSHEIILNTSLQKSLNQVQAEFTLQARAGNTVWQKNTLDNLPGVAIFMMPEYQGMMRDLFSTLFPSINIWPARFINFPSDFRSVLAQDMSKSDSKIEGQQEVFSRQYVRIGGFSARFPEFEVVGIIPSRSFIYLLILFFACFFVAVVSMSILKLRS